MVGGGRRGVALVAGAGPGIGDQTFFTIHHILFFLPFADEEPLARIATKYTTSDSLLLAVKRPL